MPYVGNSPAANFASVTKDAFSGDGSTTAFTLSKAATTNGVAVFVENVRQEPTTAYAVSGTTLTFTAAPVSASGNNIYVLHHNAPASTATHPAAQALEATSGTFSAGVSGTTGTFTSDVSIDGGSFVFNESSADKDFRVESNGESHMLFVDGGNDAVILGHSAKVDGINDDNEGVKGSGGHLQLHGATPCIDVFSYSTTNGTHGGINFMKSRNNTVGSNTVITTGDVIGSIAFGGFDGADYASIMGKIDFQAGGSGMAENDTAGEMVFYTTPDGSGGSGSNERMRIESDGTVRITSQDLKVGQGSTADAKVQFDANSDWTIGIDASDGGYLKVSNGEEVHSAPKMVFKGGGLIEHLASRNGNLNYFQNSHSSDPYGLSIAFDQASPDNNTNYFLRMSDGTQARATIWSDGDVATSDAGTLSSDEKLKNTITDATDKWDDVKKLKVRNFYWNEDYHPKKKDKKMIGFIAQEFETVFPGLVKGYKDTIDKEVEDENGFKSIEAVETGTTTKHIKEGKLIPILTKALQEAMTRIETLEAKVKTLEEA